MKNEIYIWIAIFVIIAAAALYYRFYYTASYQLTVSFNKTQLSRNIYPYQNVAIPIIVTNTGSSAISNLDFGLYMNGSLKNTYKLDIPVGKTAVIPFNYTPAKAGTYNFSVVADPGRVFSISDRAQAQSNAGFLVSNSESPSPYSYIARNGLVSGSYANLKSSGVVTDSFFYTNFSSSPIVFSNISALNTFLYPITSIAGTYINEMAYSNGEYSGNNAISSIWLKGYLEPSAFVYAAGYKGFIHHNFTYNGTQVTFVKLSNISTMCSWYSSGWIKIIGTNGTENCTRVLEHPSASHYIPDVQNIKFMNDSFASNATVIGNYSGFVGNVFSHGELLEMNNSVHYMQIATNLTNPLLVCYGAIYNISGISYCSSYDLPVSGKIGNFSLISTRAYVGGINYTDYSLSSTSKLLETVPEAIGLIHASLYNSSAKSLVFLPGIQSACGFVEGFNCTGVSFSNSTLNFRVINNYNSTVALNAGSCFAEAPSLLFTKLNYTLKAKQAANISVGCTYYNSTRIYGVPFNLYLGLTLNYTLNRTRLQANGSAYVV